MRRKQFFTRVDSLDVLEAKKFMNKLAADQFTLLDVRQPAEYESGHIPGAKLIPLLDLNQRIDEIDPAKPTIVYCAVGGRSRVAAQMLAGQGFTQVINMAGGKLDQLSGGEQQRVVIARAICQEPKILLLDEPTASLDLGHQSRVMDLMERLKAEKGITVLMVSHDINLAAMYADQLLLLRSGAIVGIGAPKEILNFKTLEETYDCKVLVDESPLGKSSRVTVVPDKFLNP